MTVSVQDVAGSVSPRDIDEILLPRPHYASIVAHAYRKLGGYYLPEETEERKAFGLLAGVQRGRSLDVTGVFPLIVNMRHDADFQADMDEIVDEHAIPSETPMAQRGWIASPREVVEVDETCDRFGWQLLGNYHTHRVGWPNDPDRDRCTRLDRELADNSGQWMFILSVVRMDRPILRAYFEGRNECEARIRIQPSRPVERR